MERDYMDGKENVYLACRKKAAEYNDKLNSREMAAELLGFPHLPLPIMSWELRRTFPRTAL